MNGAGLWAILLLHPALLSSAERADAGRRAPLTGLQGRATSDAGVGTSVPRDEDLEISQNLELLEHLEESRDLDLLLELSHGKPPPTPK